MFTILKSRGFPHCLVHSTASIPRENFRKRVCPAFGHRCELCSHENHYEFMCGAKAKKAKEAQEAKEAKEAKEAGGQ